VTAIKPLIQTTLIAIDIPRDILRAAEKEAEKSGRRVYEVLAGYCILGCRTAQVRKDHIRKEKVK
jgi:hypothetical protein